MPRKSKPTTFDYIVPQLQSLAIPIADLEFDTKNTRRHGKKNVEGLRASLQRFKQYLPIIVQEEGMVIRIGNCRTQAALDLGWTHIAAVVVPESGVDAVARAITDNRLGELGEWDWAVLTESLQEQELGLDELGWDPEELSALLETDFSVPEVDLDDEPPQDSSAPGESSELGAGSSDKQPTLTLGVEASKVLRASAGRADLSPDAYVLSELA
ncbi:MAG: hypothetical protein COA94_05975 [Rickettsiales bacterium]|nr:MAG: hypothetical protein COA94_05975 [Rickettsiales bacterium]